ncbi:MAG TPA: phage tail tape measure protein, partial [Thermoleophilia bacterium]
MTVVVGILTTYNGAGSKKALRELAMLEKQATLAGNGVAAGMFKASAGMQKAGAQMATTGAAMSKWITLPVVAIGAVSVVMAAKFESAMKLIQTQANGSAKDVKFLSDAILGMKGVQHSPLQLAAAMYHLKSVGMDNVTAMKALTQAERLASVGHADLEQTTNAVAAAYKSGIKGAHSFGQTVGTLNAIIGAGNLRMDDLVSAMGTGFLVNAQQWGVSLTSVGAALATMTSRGIPATRAAMALKMAFAGMGAPSAVAEKAMAKLDLKSRDLAVALREKGLGGALDILKGKLAGLSKTDQSIALTNMFGAKSSQAILTLLGNLKDYDRTQKQVAANAGKFDDLAAAQKKDLTAKWDNFKSSMAQAAILIGNVLMPTAIRLADALHGVGAWLNKLSPGTRKWVVELALVAAAAGPVILIMGKLLTVGGQVIAVVGKLSLALSANPIGLIIIAIVALVAAFVILWEKCDWFRNFWIGMWGIVKAEFALVWPAIKVVVDLIVAGIQWLWNAVSAQITWFWGWAGPFITASVHLWWQVISTTFTTIVTVVQTAWNAIAAGVTWFWGWAGPFITTAIGLWWTNIKTTFNLIKAVFDTVWPLIVAVVRTAVSNVKAAIDTIEAVVAFVRGVWDRVHGAAVSVWDAITGAVRAAIGNVKAAIYAVESVVAFVRGVFNDINAVAASVGDRITATVGDIWRGIKGVAKTVWDDIVGVVRGAFNSIKGFANGVIGAINHVVGVVPGLGHNVPGYPFPLFARGGITRGPSIAGEAGPEAIIPLDNPRRAVQVMAEAGLTGG